MNSHNVTVSLLQNSITNTVEVNLCALAKVAFDASVWTSYRTMEAALPALGEIPVRHFLRIEYLNS